MSAKEAAARLLVRAREEKVRLPLVWDESTAMQNCGSALMLHRDGAGFNEAAALQDLIAKYGQEAAPALPSSPIVASDTDGSPKKKRKSVGDGDGDEGPKKKAATVKKTETVAVEANRPAAEAIMEMAKVYFQNKDARKGGVFSKAAKALREADFEIKTLKQAMTLKGVGKGIATYIVEQIDTGSIHKLEELRAGLA